MRIGDMLIGVLRDNRRIKILESGNYGTQIPVSKIYCSIDGKGYEITVIPNEAYDERREEK
jgi:hypothetical protein